jgi:hypothetical protein
LEVAHLDLADLNTVRAFASAWSGPLHILVDRLQATSGAWQFDPWALAASMTAG